MKYFIKFLIVFFSLATVKLYSQETYLMNSNRTIKLSEGIVYDDGGKTKSVSNTANVTTFKSENGILELYFTDFNIPYDAILKIYDGTSTKGKLIGSFTSQDKIWNFKAESITIEFIPSPSNAVGRGWRGVLGTSKVGKIPTVQSAPESDCPQAIPLCANNTAIVSASQYVDVGSINDDSGNCYGNTGSGGSVWYSFSPNATGPLDFLIIPAGSTDYDFVLWDITNGCSSKTQVLCNYSATHGSTGASTAGGSASEGASGNLLCTRPTVTLGHQYAICVNFYGGSNDGFTLQFQNQGGSVGINDVIPPTINYVTGNGCTNTSVLDVYFSEWIDCTTLQIGDFTMPGHTFGMLNNYCNGGKTNHVQISVSPALTAVAGTPTPYTLSVLNSGAGTSMNDMCGNPMNVNYVFTLGQTPTANAGPDKYNCKSPGFLGIGSNYSSVTLNGSGGAAGSVYNWSDGSTGQSPSVAPTQTTTYTLTVTQGACTATDVVTVFVENQPVVNLGPDVLMCAGLPLSMSASGGGTYQWQVQTGTVFILGTPTFGTISGAGSSTYSTNPVQYGSTGSTYYQVNVTSPNGACTATDQIKVTFGAGAFGILSTKPFLCQGESTTLSLPTGMNAYTWNTGTSANAPLVVNPGSTTSYTATSTTAGCAGTAVITVPVRPLPVVVATASPSAICIGNTATLSATPTGSNSTLTENFEAASSVFTLVNGTYNKWYQGTAAFCGGNKGLYIGTTATNNNYSISSGLGGLTSNAATNHAYTDLTVFSNCSADLSYKWKCGGNANANLTVWIVPTSFVPVSGTAITASATNILIGGPFFGSSASCNSASLSLASYSGQSVRVVFSWSNTGGILAPAVAPPAASLDDFVFNQSMSYTYNWSSSPAGLGATSQSLTVSPSVVTAYSVTVTRCDGCISSASVPLTVLPAAAALTVSPTSTICAGQSSSLTVSGGTTYTWSPSATLSSANGATVSASPTLTTVYTVSTTLCGGTISTKTVQVVVNGSPPSIGSINGQSPICANSTGNTYSVTNVAGTNYTWTVPPGATITSTPTNSNIVTVSFGSAAGTISVNAVSNCGASTASLNVTLSPALNVSITPSSTNMCSGTVTLTASGATNYTWSATPNLNTSVGSSIVDNPGATTIYTVTGATGGCTGVANATVTVGGALTLTVTPNTATVCAGSPTTLTASGAANYTWSPSSSLNVSNGSVVVASPITATTYTVFGTTGTCTGSVTATISISAGLTLTLTSNTPTVCPGGAALLEVSGANTYTWSNSSTLSQPNGTNVTALPTSNTIYTVTGSAGGCIGTATISVGIGICVSTACNLALIRSTLTAAGNIELLGMNNTCSLYFINPQFMTGPQAQSYAQTFGANLISVQSASENADLVQALSNQGYSSNVIWIGFSDALSEGNFVWYDGSPNSYSNWAPGEPNNAGGNENCVQIYPDGGWNDLNCSGYNSLSVIEVNICPQVSIVNVPPVHCPNTDIILNASTLLGSPNYTYTWVQSGTETFTNTSIPGNTNQITVSSIGANTFTVYTEDRYSCPQSTSVTLSVSASPTITVNSPTICLSQQTATLTATGANTYTWSTGLSSANGSVVSGNPIATQAYTVTGEDVNGCIGKNTTTITVNNLPEVSANSATICLGAQTATLIAQGATTYTWIPATGLNTAFNSTVLGTPLTSQNYTVIGVDGNGCAGANTATITVNQLPVIGINSATICLGQQTATLNASGASSYTWIPSNGLNTTFGSAVTGTPSATQNYTVAGIDGNGCGNFTVTTITVNQLPIVVVNSASICLGQQTATLTANGADTYNWFPGTGLSSTTNSVVTGTPSADQIYGVTGTDLNGCKATANTTITINPLPNLAISPNLTVCPLSANTLTASGAASYTWSPNIYLNNNISPTVITTPSTTITYTVNALTGACTASNVVTVTVSNTLIVTANPISATICPMSGSTLTASGATSYTWSPALTLSSANGNTVIASPPLSTTYTVIGSTSTCTNSALVVVTVTNNPIITATSNPPTICSGLSAVITASGADSYSWTPAATLDLNTGATVNASPLVNTTYNVVGTDALGCSSFTTITLNVISTPTVSALANPIRICDGKITTLSAFGAQNYTWTPSINLSNQFSNPTMATPPSIGLNTYTVYGSNGSAPFICVSQSTVQVIVIANPSLTVGNSPTICAGQSTIIYAIGGDSYTWTPNSGVANPNSSATSVNPSATTIYTVLGNNGGFCASTATIEVVVNPLPIVNAGNDTTINIDNTVVLFGTGDGLIGFISPANGPQLNCNYCYSVNVNPQETTCYTLEGINVFGCRNTDEVCVTVTKDWDVFIPNAFTPNGDINNEIFIPVGYGIEKIDLLIFDRWGHIIFKSDDENSGWDGKNKGKLCEQGVYIYQAEIKAMSGEIVKKTGHVTLLSKVK